MQVLSEIQHITAWCYVWLTIMYLQNKQMSANYFFKKASIYSAAKDSTGYADHYSETSETTDCFLSSTTWQVTVKSHLLYVINFKGTFYNSVAQNVLNWKDTTVPQTLSKMSLKQNIFLFILSFEPLFSVNLRDSKSLFILKPQAPLELDESNWQI